MSVRRERRNRKLNELLREIVAKSGNERGSVNRLADLAQTQRSYMSAMLADRRGVGDVLADRLERKCGKPAGWFDDQASRKAWPAMPPIEHSDQLIAALDYIGHRLRAVDAVTREAVALLLSRLATQPEDQVQIARILAALMPVADGPSPPPSSAPGTGKPK